MIVNSAASNHPLTAKETRTLPTPSPPRPPLPFLWLCTQRSLRGPLQLKDVPGCLLCAEQTSFPWHVLVPTSLPSSSCGHSLVCSLPLISDSDLIHPQALVHTCWTSSSVLIGLLFLEGGGGAGGSKGECHSPAPEEMVTDHSQSRCLLPRPGSPQFSYSCFPQRTFWNIP